MIHFHQDVLYRIVLYIIYYFSFFKHVAVPFIGVDGSGCKCRMAEKAKNETDMRLV